MSCSKINDHVGLRHSLDFIAAATVPIISERTAVCQPGRTLAGLDALRIVRTRSECRGTRVCRRDRPVLIYS